MLRVPKALAQFVPLSVWNRMGAIFGTVSVSAVKTGAILVDANDHSAAAKVYAVKTAALMLENNDHAAVVKVYSVKTGVILQEV